MLIDWFTVGAQALNFLVLVWLLQHFLYKPIRNAIDTREKGIAAKLADADKKAQDAQKQLGDFDQKNRDFDKQRGDLLIQAQTDAKNDHDRLVGEAQKEADTLRTVQAAALQSDQATLGREITRVAGEQVFAIARKTLSDLATASLEERIGAVFTRRLGEMSAQAKGTLGAALKASAQPAILRSAFDMPAQQRAIIQNAINENFSADVRLDFQTAPDTICGIELSANGQKVGWNIADYLTSLDQKVGELLTVE